MKERIKMKKTAFLAAALLLIALLWAAPAFAGTIPSSIVPEGARWIAHLDMEKFVATTLFESLEKDGKFEIKGRDLKRWLWMDPKDVSGLTVFGLGTGDDQVVFAVAGKFDKAGIIALVEADKKHQKTPFGAYTIYSTGSDEYGAFINDNLLVFSEGRAVIERVLGAAGGKAKNFAGTPLSASLKEVPSGAFLSGVIPDLTGLGKKLSPSKVLNQASGLFFLAQEKRDLLLVRLQVTAVTPESAKNMADIVQGLIALGRMGGNEGDRPRVARLLDGLRVQQDGKVLRLDFERPSKEIADLISHGKGMGVLLD
jgi:hypothetical protein